MADYRWEGMTPRGETVRGTIEAASAAAAARQVRATGVVVTACRRAGKTSTAPATDPAAGADNTDPDADPREPEPDDAKNQRWTVLILLILTLGGLGFAGLGVWKTWEISRLLTDARQTTGVVRSATVREQRAKEQDSNGGGSHTVTYYLPTIRYEYHVNSRAYAGEDVYPGGSLIRSAADRSRHAAERVVRRFAVGSEVSVWYPAADPAAAYLIRTRRNDAGLFALTGGLLAAVGVGLLLPTVIPPPGLRFVVAAVAFAASQAVTWLVWQTFVAVPPEEVSGYPRLLSWLLVAYGLVCWAACIGNAPPRLRSLRDATFAALMPGVIGMSLSLFVLLPLGMIAPSWEPLQAFPWVGIGIAVASLLGWATGVVTVGSGPQRVPSRKRDRR